MIFELMKETNYTENVDFIGGNHANIKKARILYAILGLILGGMLVYVTKIMALIIILPVMGFIGYKLPYYTILQKRRYAESVNRYLFTDFVGTFISVMPTSGNVYQTLNATLAYTPEPLSTGLESLINKITVSNDRAYYIEFSDYIGSSEASMVMDTIYQFSVMGVEPGLLKDLEEYAFEIEKNAQNELIESKIMRMQYLGYLPIFISIGFILTFVAVMFIEFFAPVVNGVL